MDSEENKVYCDVLVVGAGVSGVCSAVTAARKGLQVVLVEKKDFLGGVAEDSMNRYICGLYSNEKRDSKKIGDTFNDGMPREIVGMLHANYGVTKPIKIGKVFVLSLPDGALITILSQMMESYENLKQYLNAEVIIIEKEGACIVKVNIQRDEKVCSIFPKVVIDCSGDCVVSRLAQIPVLEESSSRMQLCGYSAKIVGLKNVNDSLNIKVPYLCRQYVDLTGLPDYLKYTKFFQCESNSEGMIKMNLPFEKNGFDSKLAQKYMNDLLEYLIEHLPEFSDAKISKTSKFVSSREGARLFGEYVLRKKDVLEAKKFDDAVLCADWPIEMWSLKKGVHYEYIKDNDYYEIPKRCLKSAGISNLLGAGRCISVSHEALGSTRVVGTCMSLGEAAGEYAAEIIKK